MDITPFQELKIAPRAVFDALPERRARPRFMLRSGDDWRVVTWGGFASEIARAAGFLFASELGAGERAAVFAANRVEWMSAALAIQAAGGVLVPVYPASTTDQLAYVIGHSDARVLFVDGAHQLGRVFEAWPALAGVRRIVTLDDATAAGAAEALAKLRAAGRPAPSLDEVERKLVSWSRALAIGAARATDAPDELTRSLATISLDQPGLMLYTSGTSGNPKGVPLTHRNVAINGLDWLRSNAPLIDEGATDLLWLPMSHIFGFGEACLGNTLGFTTYLCEPAQVMQLLPEVRPSVFMSVPSVWEKLAMAATAAPVQTPEGRRARLDEVTGGKLRFCLSGGAGLKREIKEVLHGCGLLVIEGYGLTETSPTLTLNRPDAFRFDSVGKPLPSVELRLAEDGEILARGPSVFGGYHKDPVATREAFTDDGWFKTGDVGRFTDDGFLQIIDRKKDILVTAGGKNVPPANIELRFRDDPFIAHVVVYGDGRRYLVAGLWLNDDAIDAQLAAGGAAPAPAARAAAIEALLAPRIARVNAELASYETLKKWTVMPRPLTVAGGLLTATLKVRRKAVYQAFAAEFEAMYA